MQKLFMFDHGDIVKSVTVTLQWRGLHVNYALPEKVFRKVPKSRLLSPLKYICNSALKGFACELCSPQKVFRKVPKSRLISPLKYICNSSVKGFACELCSPQKVFRKVPKSRLISPLKFVNKNLDALVPVKIDDKLKWFFRRLFCLQWIIQEIHFIFRYAKAERKLDLRAAISSTRPRRSTACTISTAHCKKWAPTAWNSSPISPACSPRPPKSRRWPTDIFTVEKCTLHRWPRKPPNPRPGKKIPPGVRRQNRLRPSPKRPKRWLMRPGRLWRPKWMKRSRRRWIPWRRKMRSWISWWWWTGRGRGIWSAPRPRWSGRINRRSLWRRASCWRIIERPWGSWWRIRRKKSRKTLEGRVDWPVRRNDFRMSFNFCPPFSGDTGHMI